MGRHFDSLQVWSGSTRPLQFDLTTARTPGLGHTRRRTPCSLPTRSQLYVDGPLCTLVRLLILHHTHFAALLNICWSLNKSLVYQLWSLFALSPGPLQVPPLFAPVNGFDTELRSSAENALSESCSDRLGEQEFA
jgi:hypothetical protein